MHGRDEASREHRRRCTVRPRFRSEVGISVPSRRPSEWDVIPSNRGLLHSFPVGSEPSGSTREEERERLGPVRRSAPAGRPSCSTGRPSAALRSGIGLRRNRGGDEARDQLRHRHGTGSPSTRNIKKNSVRRFHPNGMDLLGRSCQPRRLSPSSWLGPRSSGTIGGSWSS